MLCLWWNYDSRRVRVSESLLCVCWLALFWLGLWGYLAAGGAWCEDAGPHSLVRGEGLCEE